ncbi:transposase family protein [Nostoc sp. UHCC 0870]|uniref:transposase family protein n=1 Tax=Nostoc sp. UHCC 0870 TaxID=2914041 RepID=UPI003FA5CCB2
MNLIEAIQGVPDYRHARGIRHKLWIILTIVLLGSCTGYWGYKPLAEFTKNHRSILITMMKIYMAERLLVKSKSIQFHLSHYLIGLVLKV